MDSSCFRRVAVSRLTTFFILLFFACQIAGIAVGAQAPRATDKPFLWRIDGRVPSYLYGTVHVPDARVLELPQVVQRAFDAADVFNAEIPLDSTTQLEVMNKLMLPAGQDLRKIAGEEVFSRLMRVITKNLKGGLPAGMADILAGTLAPMKPWAAMSQLELLEYLPDVMSGRQPLDAMLYGMAVKGGKEVGGLETVDEQVAVFDGFTMDEQVRMLVSTLDEMEKPRAGGVSSSRVASVRARACSPVASSSTRARSANALIRNSTNIARARRNCSRASSLRGSRRSHSPYSRWARARSTRAPVRPSR